MTAPDVRTAAQAEAEQRWRRDAGKPWHRVFVSGAVWGAALVTPTREQIARAILMVTQGDVSPDYAWSVQFDEVREELLAQADAVLALMNGR